MKLLPQLEKNILTVVVVSYNHENYIRTALESIFQQTLSFGSTEVLVLDDGSTDDTLKMVGEMKPPLGFNLRVFPSKQNNGVLANIKRAFPYVSGKYVAFLDGDDQWLYDRKLEEQLSFLENNPDYNGCFHDARIHHQDTTAETTLFARKNHYSELYDYRSDTFASELINRLIIPSSALVVRSGFLKDPALNLITDDYSTLWKIECLSIKESKYRYMNEVWSEYRNHSGGISKGNNSAFHLSHIAFLRSLLKDDHYKNTPLDIWCAIEQEQRVLLDTMLVSRDGPLFKRVFVQRLFSFVKLNYYLFKKFREQ